MPEGAIRQRTARDCALIVALTFAALAPFLNKAFHIDDPVYIRVAQQIVEHPLDPYGFEMNWYGTAMLVHEFNQNPPGVSYYLALAGWLFGWGERALHGAMLLPAIALNLGVYALARRFTARPMTAVLVSFLTPAILVSSTNVMTDVLMLAFYVWAIAAFVYGIKPGNVWLLAASGALMGAAFFTKYFGITLLPLLFVYGVMEKRKAGPWLVTLVIPLALVLAYQGWTTALYGRGLFSAATAYASGQSAAGSSQSAIAMGFAALCFTGGCFFSALFFTPMLWSRRGWIAGALIAGVAVLVPLMPGSFVSPALTEFLDLSAVSIVLIAVFIAGGVQIVTLAALELRRRNAEGVLLFCWCVGTLAFAAYMNWTVNARSLLPLGPVAGILVARRLEERGLEKKGVGWPRREALAHVCAGAMALWVALGDYQFAEVARVAAARVKEYQANATVYFQGHWGFQYYMEAAGIPAQDFVHSPIKAGDIIAIPWNNTNTQFYPPDQVQQIDSLSYPLRGFMATTNISVGAGFYSHGYGPLPFVIGPVPNEVVWVYRVRG